MTSYIPVVRALTMRELVIFHPKAFEALPEPYQSDSCLVFWEDSDGALWCAPTDDQEVVLGKWESIYNPTTRDWAR